MKTKLYNILLITFAIVFASITEARDKKGKYTREKEIKNSYKTEAYFNLHIQNSFGEVKVETWDKNEVFYQIQIVSNGDNLDKVQDRLDNIRIRVTENKNSLSLVTETGKDKNNGKTFTSMVKNLINGNWNSNNNRSSHIEINYLIYVPKMSDLDVMNDYGMIYLGEIKGKTEINSDYGGLHAEALLSDFNTINLDYASKSTITHLKNGVMNINYSSVYLSHVGELELIADYSTSKIDSVKQIDFSVDYGGITINKAEVVYGNSDYAQVQLGEIDRGLDIKLSYGGLKINRVNSSFKKVLIHSDYASVKLGMDNSQPFMIDVDTDYAGLKGIGFYEVLEKRDGRYRGYNLKKDLTKRIDISADYGSVTLFPAS